MSRSPSMTTSTRTRFRSSKAMIRAGRTAVTGPRRSSASRWAATTPRAATSTAPIAQWKSSVRLGTLPPWNAPGRGYRSLVSWFSHRDATGFFRACVERPNINYEIIYGASNNTWTASRFTTRPTPGNCSTSCPSTALTTTGVRSNLHPCAPHWRATSEDS